MNELILDHIVMTYLLLMHHFIDYYFWSKHIIPPLSLGNVTHVMYHYSASLNYSLQQFAISKTHLPLLSPREQCDRSGYFSLGYVVQTKETSVMYFCSSQSHHCRYCHEKRMYVWQLQNIYIWNGDKITNLINQYPAFEVASYVNSFQG